MVQFLSIFFFLGFLQFLLGFSKVPVFLCHSVFVTTVFNLQAEFPDSGRKYGNLSKYGLILRQL